MGDELGPVLVTGIAGDRGRHLIAQIDTRPIIGVDVKPPAFPASLAAFSLLDFGKEASCQKLATLLLQTGATAVVHLAFVDDEARDDARTVDRMWQVNVAGTARVLEAIGECNRNGGVVRRFIYPGSAMVYGCELQSPATEQTPLAAQTLPSALHRMEADQVTQMRTGRLRGCATYILRTAFTAGADADNVILRALRGYPPGNSRRATKRRADGRRSAMVLPKGEAYERRPVQFVHSDDVARVIGWLLARTENGPTSAPTILNVAGRGEPITLAEAAEVAQARLRRLPTRALCRRALRFMWDVGISPVPPEALPYLVAPCMVDTSRLRHFLGRDYEDVIRYTNHDALAESFTQA